MISYWLQLTFFKMGFWITWTIIPVLVEILPALISACQVYLQGRQAKILEMPDKLPFISIVVPVYNSEDTLFACLDSIDQSTYPNEAIQVIVVDNQSTDNSFIVFADAQNRFKTMNLLLIKTTKGKANALNVAMYNAIGTYIFNIDSDGVLEKQALMNMVLRFEDDQRIAAMTGTILSTEEDIKQTKSWFLRVLQKNEYFEYGQAFLSGRVIETSHNQLFTMSGAFSSFRRDVLLRTFMYSTDTVGEDTDMTFQIRQRLGDKVALCPDALFFIEPISGLQELYTQRQRWQRGELEVTKKYMGEKSEIIRFFSNFLLRRAMLDHTFVFPKMIWFFASVVLLFFRYSPVILMASYLLIYLLYVVVDFFNFVCVRLLLKPFDEQRTFYTHLWWAIFTLPVYNLVCFWFRLVGIINMMTRSDDWNSASFSVEAQQVKNQVLQDVTHLFGSNKN